jgi:regulatory protein
MAHTITALKAQKRNPNRINVYLDGEFSFGLSRIVAAWLSVGQVISDEKISTLKVDDELEIAFQKAVNFIGHRMRSSTDVEKYLSKKAMHPEIINLTLDRLKRSRIIDDDLFAQEWTDNRSEFRPRSRRAIKQELRLKGIPDEVIESTLEEMLPEEDLAYQAGAKYTQKIHTSDRFEFFRKLGGFLARRGFSYDVIKPAVTRLWDEQDNNHSKIDDMYSNSKEDEEER